MTKILQYNIIEQGSNRQTVIKLTPPCASVNPTASSTVYSLEA